MSTSSRCSAAVAALILLSAVGTTVAHASVDSAAVSDTPATISAEAMKAGVKISSAGIPSAAEIAAAKAKNKESKKKAADAAAKETPAAAAATPAAVTATPAAEAKKVDEKEKPAVTADVDADDSDVRRQYSATTGAKDRSIKLQVDTRPREVRHNEAMEEARMLRDRGLEAPSEEFMNNLEKHMPDLTDEDVKAHLRCSSCNAITHELYDRLTVINKNAFDKGYKSGAKDYEMVDAMDLMCREMSETWGLRVVGNSIEPEYTHASTTKYQIRSGWARSYLQDRCSELTDAHEEKIFRIARRKRELPEWLEYTCVVLDQSCTATDDSPANVAARKARDEAEKRQKRLEAAAKRKAEEEAKKKEVEEKRKAKAKKSGGKKADKKDAPNKKKEEIAAEKVAKELEESVGAAKASAEESADL